MPTHAAIRSLFLDGPAGRLEALLNVGGPSATHCALVAHPHPLYGGTMHNKVVFSAMKALNSLGFPVLRFNFRGTASSAGEHDYGGGEVDDVRTAIDWLRSEFRLPIVFAGFSFGAAVGLNAVCSDQRVAAIVSLGIPIEAEGRRYSYEVLRECRIPKLFVSGDHDQFARTESLSQIIATAAEPKRLVLVRDADHFFQGHLEEVREIVRSWLVDILQVKTE
jgi:alpha/beta superfamily hydrolase